MIDNILFEIKKYIPKKLFHFFQPYYHRILVFFAAFLYRFPSRHINVVLITGTKGKSTVVEMINAILEEANKKTAVNSTIRLKVGEKSRPNPYKMTLHGRFFLQKFLRQAVKEKCDVAIVEMTSQAVLQYRHKHLDIDGFIFTNLSPEHIESHGSYENYREAKLTIGRLLEKSRKPNKVLVVNADDPEKDRFLSIKANVKKTYDLKSARPYDLGEESLVFTWQGERIALSVPGEFNVYNALAAASYADAIGIEKAAIKRGLEKFKGAKGRVEFIKEGQNFDVVVDYAHTIDSLEKFYKIFEGKNNICVLGNTGGGRDKWKRGEMARVAEKNCIEVILTNEDPYDEDPKEIVGQMHDAIEDKLRAHIIMDRREAIREALRKAKLLSGNKEKKVAVLVTGKGTDPSIMISGGRRIPWDDASVCREEIKKVMNKS
jgi:UDP-N-acetylmuramoyl-L-alanyl-D-glutamate--2,6-diaminopimelate ligase